MDGEIRRLYREQYDMYLPLLQEEVEVLYASEGICDKQASDVVHEIEDEIRDLNSEREKYLKTTFSDADDEQSERDRTIFFKIHELEEKKQKVIKIQRELQALLPDDASSIGLLSSIANIEKEIERLREEQHKIHAEQERTIDEKNRFCRECEEKICELKEKLDKIKLDYASVFRQLYSSSRGIIKKNRKFPSDELRNKIVLGHLGLAKGLAGRYFKSCDHAVEFDELLQTAYEALMSAAHYYVPSPRATFKTYARKCIENKLKRAIRDVKKKQRRRPTKPLEFIDEELRRVDYIMMFIDANKSVTNKKGEKSFSNHFRLSPTGIQYKFKNALRSYNKERRELGECKSQLPWFKVKRSENGLKDIMSIVMRYLKESKIKVLVSDEDIEMASMVVSYENHAHDIREIYELLYILELYKTRLRNVRTLLEVELDLTSGEDGIVPTSEEILAQINQKVASENKGIYKAKHNPNPVSYKSLDNYSETYYELWRYDFLAPSDRHDSRAAEKRNLEDDFRYLRNELIVFYTDYCDDIIDDDEDLPEEIYLYLHRGEENGDYKYFDYWDGECLDSIESREFSKERAVEFFKKLIQGLKDMIPEEYVRAALKERKQITLDELNAKNDQIIKGNRDKEDTIRQQRAKGYVRYWTIEQVREVSNWLTLLHESGLFVSYSRNHSTPSQSLNVEDEVIGDMFREDYLRGLNELTPLAQKIMLMYYDENGTHSFKAKEIASKLGIKENDVYREKAKALKLLRKNGIIQGYLE